MRERTPKWLTMLPIIVVQCTFDKSVCVSATLPPIHFRNTTQSQFLWHRNCVHYYYFRFWSKMVKCDRVNYYGSSIGNITVTLSLWWDLLRTTIDERCLTASCDGYVINHPSYTFRWHRFRVHFAHGDMGLIQPASQPFTPYFVATTTSFYAQHSHLRRCAYVHCGFVNERIPVSQIGNMKPYAFMVSIEQWVIWWPQPSDQQWKVSKRAIVDFSSMSVSFDQNRYWEAKKKKKQTAINSKSIRPLHNLHWATTLH